MKIEEIRELAKIVSENGLESIEFQDGQCNLKITRPVAVAVEPMVQPVAAPQQVVVAAAPAAAEAEAPAAPAEEGGGSYVKSPMVGIFYAAASPEAENYVHVGSKVKKGDVLCIIEAMKLMNEITAEVDGEIAKVCVENGQVVEFGQPLFKLV